jgi:alginate O-acetyltransferase complex protein AlgJ
MTPWLRHSGHALLVMGFFSCLWLPLADLLLGLERPPRIVENREPAPPPRLAPTGQAIAEFPRAFEAYWNDRFGFRRTLIRLHALAGVRLGVSPSEKVIFGKSRWLFSDEELPWRNPPGRAPLTEDQLARWRRELEARRDWLRARGAHYLFVIVPNKATVYPEYLPGALTPPATPTDVDRLVRDLRAHSDVAVLDLRAALLQAKTEQLVYHPADTHWSDPGIYAAYAAIIDCLAPWFPGMSALPPSAFESIHHSASAHGDLAEMVGLREYFAHEAIELRQREPRRARPSTTSVAGSPGRRPPFATELPAAAPRALIFNDSFGLGLAPFLSEHFARAVYVTRHEFDPAAVVQERPDVVIQEVAERLLKWDLVPADLPR